MMNIGLTVLTVYMQMYNMIWHKCMLRGIEFPPTLGEECG